jgi:hypothetical protein
VLSLTAAVTVVAQQTSTPKRVVVLYWYDKNYAGHVRWEQGWTSSMQSANEQSIEYYPEYLEANRFPEENQPQVLHDYLKQKYAEKPIDVVVCAIRHVVKLSRAVPPRSVSECARCLLFSYSTEPGNSCTLVRYYGCSRVWRIREDG